MVNLDVVKFFSAASDLQIKLQIGYLQTIVPEPVGEQKVGWMGILVEDRHKRIAPFADVQLAAAVHIVTEQMENFKPYFAVFRQENRTAAQPTGVSARQYRNLPISLP
jgi:hypothetical protein